MQSWVKSGPNIENSTIAACLGLDEDLINEIQKGLVSSRFLYNTGTITDLGREKLENPDSLEIAEKEEGIGYVFQFVDHDDYYPYYIKREDLGESPNVTNKGDIITGTKGDGRDGYCTPLPLDFIERERKQVPTPNERSIFKLIYSERVKTEDISEAQLREKLSLSFLNGNPEPILVRVCTYIYLPQIEDNLYEQDWQLLDPFKPRENNVKLKFYLESFKDKSFEKMLTDKFGDADTIDKKNFREYNQLLNEKVDEICYEDFGMEILSLDKNLVQYIKSIVKNVIILRQCNYSENDAKDMFMISCQKILETILRNDWGKRSPIYEEMFSEFSTPVKGKRDDYVKKRRSFLRNITREEIIKMTDPNRLISLSKNIEPNGAKSLKGYVYNLILTYKYDQNSFLLKLLKDDIEKIFDLADLRNERGHGQTENNSQKSNIDKDNIEDYYDFIKKVINKYK